MDFEALNSNFIFDEQIPLYLDITGEISKQESLVLYLDITGEISKHESLVLYLDITGEISKQESFYFNLIGRQSKNLFLVFFFGSN